MKTGLQAWHSTVSALLPTEFGPFRIHSFANEASAYNPHLVLQSDFPELGEKPLVRIHSECLTGDVFSSIRCDCGFQLKRSMQLLGNEPGLLIYLRQEGRGIGLHSKIQAYQKQDEGMDTVEANLFLGYEADERDYALAAELLHHFKVSYIRLLTNNPDKASALEHYGIQVIERIPLIGPVKEENLSYLQTKKLKLGHLLPDMK